MLKKLALVFACSVIGSIVSFNVQAFPVSSPSERAVKPDVTLVRNFCGLGFHRSVYGYCVRNGTPYYAPPVVVARPFRRLSRPCVHMATILVRTAAASLGEFTKKLCSRVLKFDGGRWVLFGDIVGE